uniref:Uncharacterized protein n=1 Tax=Arundo donax TaxID=35708 RepID=A0A0A9B440_ARUDO
MPCSSPPAAAKRSEPNLERGLGGDGLVRGGEERELHGAGRP